MRDLILKQLAAKGISRYKLAADVAGKVSQQAVYGFLAGKRDMTSGLVMHLLDASGLEITPKVVWSVLPKTISVGGIQFSRPDKKRKPKGR